MEKFDKFRKKRFVNPNDFSIINFLSISFNLKMHTDIIIHFIVSLFKDFFYT